MTWVYVQVLGVFVGSPLAQSVERSPCKRRIPGSSPGLAAYFSSVLLHKIYIKSDLTIHNELFLTGTQPTIEFIYKYPILNRKYIRGGRVRGVGG